MAKLHIGHLHGGRFTFSLVSEEGRISCDIDLSRQPCSGHEALKQAAALQQAIALAGQFYRALADVEIKYGRPQQVAAGPNQLKLS